jgi:diguanylate cyclase (GGDEF)-like protein
MILVKVAQAMKSGIPGGSGPGEAGRLEIQESVLRAYDIAGRYGGDEFIIGLPYCDEEKAISIANRLRVCFEEIHFDDFPGVQVRGSFGIAVLSPDRNCPDIKDLVALADVALYKSKAAGRNRISIIHYFGDRQATQGS